jgi:hypothetical protein
LNIESLVGRSEYCMPITGDVGCLRPPFGNAHMLVFVPAFNASFCVLGIKVFG